MFKRIGEKFIAFLEKIDKKAPEINIVSDMYKDMASDVCAPSKTIYLKSSTFIVKSKRAYKKKTPSKILSKIRDQKYNKILKLVDKGYTVQKACEEIGISVGTFYNIKKKVIEYPLDPPIIN